MTLTAKQVFLPQGGLANTQVSCTVKWAEKMSVFKFFLVLP